MPLPPRLNRKDLAALAFLVVVGLGYYSQTYDCGFDPGDEGSLMLLTMRILDGERPYVDLGLGYGLLWYYPLALLFKITGVSFIAARIYLLSLAVASALLAYLTVRRHTEVRPLAIAVGLLILALPGNLQSVYIPFAVLANMLALSCLDLDRPTLEGRRVFAAAVVVALTWHVRPDIGLCAATVLLGTLIWHAVSNPPRSWPKHLLRLAARVGGAALVPTLPLVLIAYRQDFLRSFLAYSGWPLRYLKMIPTLFRIGAFEEPAADAPAQAGTTLARLPLSVIWEGGPLQLFGVLTHLPLFTMALVAALACFLMFRRRHQHLPVAGDETLGVLALVGLAVSAFPQFFLFRPEPAHLSFFMPGYAVLAAVCVGRWMLPGPDRTSEKAAGPARRAAFMRPLGLVVGGLLAAHVGAYLFFGVNLPTTGSMAAIARGRTERYIGANGVHVALSPYEQYVFNRVSRVVEEHSDPDDLLLCFPFGPGWNVITDRRTPMYTLYVDDSMLRRGIQQTILEIIDRELPPVILVHNWAVNGTQISRFKSWATLVMERIESEYVLLESHEKLELYVRQTEDRPG